MNDSDLLQFINDELIQIDETHTKKFRDLSMYELALLSIITETINVLIDRVGLTDKMKNGISIAKVI